MAVTSSPDPNDDDRKRAQVYFDRGKIVAQTENYEYAIEMYVQGLQIAPDSIDAVTELRDISLMRKARGGKDMGMLQRLKMPKSGDSKQKLLNALHLLAYSPGDTYRMLAVGRAAAECDFDDIAQWAVKLIERSKQRRRGPWPGRGL
jgi:tetratricopeptide (TPR) repeat protein